MLALSSEPLHLSLQHAIERGAYCHELEAWIRITHCPRAWPARLLAFGAPCQPPPIVGATTLHTLADCQSRLHPTSTTRARCGNPVWRAESRECRRRIRPEYFLEFFLFSGSGQDLFQRSIEHGFRRKRCDQSFQSR